MPVCNKCGIEKEESRFPYHKTNYHPYGQCLDCKDLAKKLVKRKDRKYYADWARQDRKKNPRKTENNRLRLRFQITLEERESLAGTQNFCCALCKRPNLKLQLDHDHAHDSQHPIKSRWGCRKCIRGLLCNHCNGRMIPTFQKIPHLR